MSWVTRFGKALAWFSGAAYLLFIAYLGLQFHQIQDYKITEIEQLSEGVQPSAIPLTFVRLISSGRSEYEPERYNLRLSFSIDEDSEPLAAFIPRLSPDAQISVNGVVVRPLVQSYPAWQINRPLLITIPDQLLQTEGSNELAFELSGFSSFMMLSSFYLGPQSELEPAYDYFDWFRYDLIRISFAVTLLLAVFMATIWMVRRQFNEYGWLSLAFLAFSYYLLMYMNGRQSIHHELQVWSFLVARAIFIFAFVLFIHQFLKLQRRWFEVTIGAFYGLVFSVGLVLVLRDDYRQFMALTYFTSLPMLLLLISYVCVLLANALRKSSDAYLHWLLVASLLGLVLGIHDLMVIFGVPHWLFRTFFISHYVSLFMAIGLGGVLVHRIAHALFNSEDLNMELNRQIAQKTLELESASEQRLNYEKKIALYDERQRIIADMHDGVGGQLVGLLAANRNGGLGQKTINHELDQILADLRLVLDALTPAGEELLSAMARLKERYTQVLASADCQLHWHIDSSIESIPMQPSQTINILRLIQEAVQNSLKHAQAKNIRVNLALHDEGYLLAITDDGIGISDEALKSEQGFGTQTMQQRASAVAGKLEISSPDSGGTAVTLYFSNKTADNAALRKTIST